MIFMYNISPFCLGWQDILMVAQSFFRLMGLYGISYVYSKTPKAKRMDMCKGSASPQIL